MLEFIPLFLSENAAGSPPVSCFGFKFWGTGYKDGVATETPNPMSLNPKP